MLSLDMFGFKALWSPFYFFILIIILTGFFFVTVVNKNRLKDSEPLTKRQGIYFSVGILLLYVIKGSPLDLMGHLMFYTHMIQMAILYLLIPQFFIIGIPQWIWRKIIHYPLISPVIRLFTNPIIAIISFNGMFSLYHVPLIFDVVKTNMWIHGAFTVVLFVLAVFMWWPLINEVDRDQKLSGIKKIAYIFANGILLTPACALIIFSDVPMYSTFSDPRAWSEALQLCVPQATLASLGLNGPEMFNSMSLLHDQQLGGVLMKILQEIIYGIVLFQVFFEWYREEQEETLVEREHLYPPLM
jgi:putative membrane protein